MKPTQEMIEAEHPNARILLFHPAFTLTALAEALATARMEGHNAGVEKAASAVAGMWTAYRPPRLREVTDAIHAAKIGGDA